MMKLNMNLAAVVLVGLFSAVQPASAQYLADRSTALPNPTGQHIWLEVTRPMLGCSASLDDPELTTRLHNAFADWMGGQRLPDGCSVIPVGKKLLLDYIQPNGAVRLIEVCPSGCLPSMWPVYMPQHSFVGTYLRPTNPPARNTTSQR
jgi:hypothetical protein